MSFLILKTRTYVPIIIFEVIRLTYKPLPYEIWVAKLFQNIGIYEPHQLDINYIANKLKIHLAYSSQRCYSAEWGSFKIININNELNKLIQREIFFHELCHILRHYGYQYKLMPKMFRDLQEWDAQRFVRYAAIPYHMLKFIDYESLYIIDQMVSTFKISPKICMERLEQIKSRSFVNYVGVDYFESSYIY